MPEKRARRSVRPLSVAIVGAGKVGTVLGRILKEEGTRVVCVVSRSLASARKASRFIGCRRATTSLRAIPPDTDLIYITTPHDAVEQVAVHLAGLDAVPFRGLSVCHASGMLTAAALAPLAAKGATVFSFHPLQTFPRDFAPREIVPTARGIVYGVDGAPRAIAVARRLARALCGTIVEVPPTMRPYYHAACVVASNHVTAVLSILEAMYGKMKGAEAGFFPVFQPIIAATLRNIGRTSPAAALSGPVVRGGIATVRGHLAAIAAVSPELMPYFAALTVETARLARAKGALSESQEQAMIDLVRLYSQPSYARGHE